MVETRVWANGKVCPHCGNVDQDKLTKLEGKAHRPGVYQCNEPKCRKQLTVTLNTVFERFKIPLTKWIAALLLMTASKNGISHQVRLFGNLARTIGATSFKCGMGGTYQHCAENICTVIERSLISVIAIELLLV